MSTRINGRIARMPIAQVYERLIALRTVMAKLGGQIIDAEIAKEMANTFDRISIGLIDQPAEPTTAAGLASQIFREIDERFKNIQTTKARDPAVDTSFELYLFPNGDNTLVIPNCEQEAMIELLEADGWLTDYHWQNATDKPAEISDEEWDKREVDWDKVMPTGVPAHTCLLYALFDGRPYRHTQRDRIWKLIPEREKRIAKLAADIHTKNNWNPEKGFSQFFDIRKNYDSDAELRKKSEATIQDGIVDITPESPLIKRI